MSPDQIRRELYSYYGYPAWKKKVDKMSDTQAAAVLIRLQSSGRAKHDRAKNRNDEH